MTGRPGRMRFALLPLATPIALMACVPAADPPAPPPPPVAPVAALPPPTPQAGDWRDWPVTPGNWVYRRDGRGSIALFGPAGGNARLTLRCDLASRRLYLSREGAGASPLAIRTSTGIRTLAVQPTGGTPAYVATALAPQELAARRHRLQPRAFRGGAGERAHIGGAGLAGDRAGGRGLPRLRDRRRRNLAQSACDYKSCSRPSATAYSGYAQSRACLYQPAKGGDPMSHGSAVSSVRFVRGTRR